MSVSEGSRSDTQRETETKTKTERARERESERARERERERERDRERQGETGREMVHWVGLIGLIAFALPLARETRHRVYTEDKRGPPPAPRAFFSSFRINSSPFSSAAVSTPRPGFPCSQTRKSIPNDARPACCRASQEEGEAEWDVEGIFSFLQRGGGGGG